MTEKKEHEVAVDQFKEADTAYKALQEKILSGMWLLEAGSVGGPEYCRSQWLVLLEQAKTLLEDRNAKLKTAQHAMRAAVVMNDTQWRGPKGEPTKLAYGPLSVSSVTHRNFDAESLLNLAREYGLYERMLELQTKGADGKTTAAVKQVWDIDYDHVKKWLEDNGLVKILDGAYDEKEKTPMVTGGKAIAFFGDEIK